MGNRDDADPTPADRPGSEPGKVGPANGRVGPRRGKVARPGPGREGGGPGAAGSGESPAVDAIGRPRRLPYKDLRAREHLTEAEVKALAAAAAKLGRHGHRDATMIRCAFYHGLRAGELCGLRREQLDLEHKVLKVNRTKGSIDAVHPIPGPELRDLKRLLRESPASKFVFVSERGSKMTPSNFRKLVARAGIAAGLPLPAHPHMLRHGCGYYLVNNGTDTRTIQGYLGHANIQNTVTYTKLAAGRFKGLFGGDDD